MRTDHNKQQPAWKNGVFSEGDTDPMLGFANIMDVMLVFALGLMLALISQSSELRAHFLLDQKTEVTAGRELAETPESIKKALDGSGEGLKSLGQVYLDPETGKMILIEGQ